MDSQLGLEGFILCLQLANLADQGGKLGLFGGELLVQVVDLEFEAVSLLGVDLPLQLEGLVVLDDLPAVPLVAQSLELGLEPGHLGVEGGVLAE